MDLQALGFSSAAGLRPSERKVADCLLNDPEWFSRATLSEIAEIAKVSEPTILRFSRSLGFRGFQDFKYTLIQNLANPPATVHTLISESDSVSTVISKTLEANINALISLRESLDPEVLSQAAEMILGATDLIILGFGASGIVGQDFAQKFPLFGLPIHAPVDAHQQFMAATLAKPTSIIMAISTTGSSIAVLNSAREAKSRGASIIALSGRDGPLAHTADLVLHTGQQEDTNEFTPTSSRLVQLAVVDALSVIVVLLRGREASAELRRMKHRLNSMRGSTQLLEPEVFPDV